MGSLLEPSWNELAFYFIRDLSLLEPFIYDG